MADKLHLEPVIVGTVVLMKKNALDMNHPVATIQDYIDERLGQRVSVQLISSVHGDPANEMQGRIGKKAYIEEWINKKASLKADESIYKVTFDWEEAIHVPGALIVRNHHSNKFYLKSITLEDFLGQGHQVHFECNSWIYPEQNYEVDRVFFANETYLPSETPETLRKYREQELSILRGNGIGELQKWDRVYDYAYYNDLGYPDKSFEYVRPVLGGSTTYPYPRRGRTGRSATKSACKSHRRDPDTESFQNKGFYVPRDEVFGHVKASDILGYQLKSKIRDLGPQLISPFGVTINDFATFEDVMKLFKGGIKLPAFPLLRKLTKKLPSFVKESLRTDGEGVLKFPLPQLIQDNVTAWGSDEEFARQMLAGVDPVVIRRLQEFPPASKLNPKDYENQTSSITKKDIEHNLNGQTVEEALRNNKLFILDHHDSLMPYLGRINATSSSNTYATRTVLFLKDDGTLKPLAIELSVPHPTGDKFSKISKVCTPAEDGIEGAIWQLAKAYVNVNDSGVHQIINHWLNTHAVIEPFIIATNRQLSSLHPVYKLLHPHFRDTMYINASARQTLINAGGIIESTFFSGKYSMEISAAAYKNWVFPDQALPADLVKRGMAVGDTESPHGVRLIIEDYPYAVDGLEIWSAIKTWVQDYCAIYYTTDGVVQNDTELQSWWKELVEIGHGDKKDEPWWPKMHTMKDLTETCTIIIWIASALHAAVNYGQYAYGGYIPNRPTLSRKFMPEEGTPEYEELKTNPEKVFLETVTTRKQSIQVVSVMEILSKHTSDEVYLGKRATSEWTKDTGALEAFEKFGQKIDEIGEKITAMNNDMKLKNRGGPVKIPYTLLYPTSDKGLTGKGIPNSVSI